MSFILCKNGMTKQKLNKQGCVFKKYKCLCAIKSKKQFKIIYIGTIKQLKKV